ncbi:MAG TPA: hypothetical protein VGE89_16335 [Bryobacteraceae bacterium]
MRHAMVNIAFLLAVGVLPALADTLPAYCGGVGAKSYTPPAVTIPAVVLNRGTVITVTNTSMLINGDTSSVKALVANPGTDGISLQEAVIATNNDPGTWVIQFASALKGSTIVEDSGPIPGLSFLSGGNVTINGDIDGDGQPDITLTSLSGRSAGFFVASGGNTINGFAIQGCGNCVEVRRPSAGLGLPDATGMTFSNITISNLVMTNIQNAAVLFAPNNGETPTSPTGNTWDHVLITGNTITGSVSGPQFGIGVGVNSGDTLQHTTIANNNMVLPTPNAIGITVSADGGVGPMSQALDTLIANNSISAALPSSGILIGDGDGSSASGALIDGMQIIANQVSITGSVPPGDYEYPLNGIVLAVGDSPSDDVLPTQYSENNTARNIGILANTIEGPARTGIQVYAASGTTMNDAISSLSILGNTLTGGTASGMALEAGGSLGASAPATGNALSDVLVQANSIQVPVPIGNAAIENALSNAGVLVWGGITAQGNSIDDIWITNNDVDTPLIGIDIIGGFGFGFTGSAPLFPADNNVVTAAQIFCNQVDQAPKAASGIKGINVVAGVDDASGNQVRQLLVADNLVGGVLGAASSFPYLGSGGSGNTLSMSQVPSPANWPHFAAAGVVNAATFQQRALAPGSLVSLFGLNLSGATVEFDGISAPILYGSSSQLNLQVPWELQGESSSWVTATANSVAGLPQPVPVGLTDPGIFSLGAPEGGQGAIVNLAGIVVDANSPAHAGDYLEIYATGLGAVTNTPQTGAVALVTPLSYLIGNATVTIGGVPATVIFAGLAPGYVGLYQVNAQVPPGVAAGNSVPVVLSTGATASNTVTISVR